MNYNGLLPTLPKEIKLFLGIFIFVLSIGFYTGLFFVKQTGSHIPQGVEQTYLGNENNPDADVMKFKKSEREMLTIIHTHILSLSMIFFFAGSVLLFAKLNKNLKFFLIIEPFFSTLLTFGGLYLLWNGIHWMKYVVIISGTLMTLTYTASAGIILSQLFSKQKPSSLSD